MFDKAKSKSVSRNFVSGQMIDFVSTATFALVIGMTLVHWLLPAVPAPVADTVTLSTAKAVVGSSIAALLVPFAYLTVRMLSAFSIWLAQHTPALKRHTR